MILHGITLGQRTVHVRIDDRDQREVERVYEATRLIERMLGRHASEVYSLLIGAVVYLGATAVALAAKFSEPVVVGFTAIPTMVFIVVSWKLIGGVVRHHQRVDGEHLYELGIASSRCREFIAECMEASPVLRRILGNFVPQPQSA